MGCGASSDSSDTTAAVSKKASTRYDSRNRAHDDVLDGAEDEPANNAAGRATPSLGVCTEDRRLHASARTDDGCHSDVDNIFDVGDETCPLPGAVSPGRSPARSPSARTKWDESDDDGWWRDRNGGEEDLCSDGDVTEEPSPLMKRFRVFKAQLSARVHGIDGSVPECSTNPRLMPSKEEMDDSGRRASAWLASRDDESALVFGAIAASYGSYCYNNHSSCTTDGDIDATAAASTPDGAWLTTARSPSSCEPSILGGPCVPLTAGILAAHNRRIAHIMASRHS